MLWATLLGNQPNNTIVLLQITSVSFYNPVRHNKKVARVKATMQRVAKAPTLFNKAN